MLFVGGVLAAAGVAGVVRQEEMSDLADGATQHCADEQAGAENTAGVARTITRGCAHKLHRQQEQHHF